MAKRIRLTANDIAEFFDELHEEFLDPFNWDPNPELPHAQRKTYTIKEFFRAKFYNRVCLYYQDEIEICKINFHEIFSGNLIYVAQVDDIRNKIKRIVNSDNFSLLGTMSSTSNSSHSISGSSTNSNTLRINNFDRFGGFKGEIDAAQLPKALDSTRKIIETRQIIEKSEDKIMDYLIPSRNVTHNVSIEKRDDTNTNTLVANNNSTNSGSSSRSMTHRKGTVALQELQALGVRLRQLRAEFIEQFNPLFHSI